MEKPWRPTKEQLLAAAGKTVDDIIAPGLAVLFCGINPGLYSGAVGHHFARPGNRFWAALHRAGFTDRQLLPFEERELLRFGLGITNLVDRSTATADELTDEEFKQGAERVKAKAIRYRPNYLGFLGVGAYRSAYRRPRAQVGEQAETLGESRIWVLPNPSGRTAHYQLGDFADEFRKLRQAAGLRSQE
ncbi:MAG: G/U mismatch-specific DNA glycosylase [Chloroflexi bacterium]|nr:G/U mismatch-specific DNA glycosylase [Chloroflexota bacterium]